MIVTENIVIKGRAFVRTWSDAGFMIERDNMRYEDACDPAEFGRTYTETTVPIDGGNATEADYLAALERLGVRADV